MKKTNEMVRIYVGADLESKKKKRAPLMPKIADGYRIDIRRLDRQPMTYLEIRSVMQMWLMGTPNKHHLAAGMTEAPTLVALEDIEKEIE